MWEIIIYAKENGREPVTEFIQSLPAKHQAKAIWEIDLLEEHGDRLQKPYVDSISGEKYKGLMELRVQFGGDISRIFYFTHVKNKIVLLHGFVKKDMKTPKRELDTALEYMKDFLRRCNHENLE